MLKKKGTGKTCEGMKGVLSEGAEVLEETKKGDLRDSGLITAAQRVEHYEMAGYGGVREYARLLGQKEIVALLDATLKEEEAADKKLTQIAKEVNAAALNGSPMRKTTSPALWRRKPGKVRRHPWQETTPRSLASSRSERARR